MTSLDCSCQMGLELSNEQRGEVITRYPFNERLLTWLRFKSIKSIERPNESLGPALVKIKEINHPPFFFWSSWTPSEQGTTEKCLNLTVAKKKLPAVFREIKYVSKSVVSQNPPQIKVVVGWKTEYEASCLTHIKLQKAPAAWPKTNPIYLSSLL